MGINTNASDAASFVTGFMPMMMLGSYIFGLNTAAFQELNRRTEYRWVAQDRIGQDPALQYVGPGGDTISLPGVIYPGFRGGGGQLDKIRVLAGQRLPQLLVDGAGNVYGRWVIEGVEERQSLFAALGQPRKQEFTISLRRFDGGPMNLLAGIVSALNPGGLVTSAQSAIASAESAAGNAVGSITSSIGKLF
ncbi:phage tail protein [Burkholderia alba]|uniref:phage tail protein n=1 Tax=Burkholderia alba TaxID=2683677 RepID=UPI002B059738|nr:phage tail protein [Burkholderia alba]